LIIFFKLKSKIASPLRSKKLFETILCETLKILLEIVVLIPVSITSKDNSSLVFALNSFINFFIKSPLWPIGKIK